MSYDLGQELSRHSVTKQSYLRCRLNRHTPARNHAKEGQAGVAQPNKLCARATHRARTSNFSIIADAAEIKFVRLELVQPCQGVGLYLTATAVNSTCSALHIECIGTVASFFKSG